MKILSASLNGRDFVFLKQKDLYDTHNKYTIILGENGTGKSELIRQLINNLLRVKVLYFFPQLVEFGKFSYRDPLDDFLSNRYKNNLMQKNLNANLNLYFNNMENVLLKYSKSNGQRSITNYKGEKVLISDEQFRYKIELICDEKINLSEITNSNIIAISESIHIKFPITQDDKILNYFYPGYFKESDTGYFELKDDKLDQKDKSLVLSLLLASLRPNDVDLKSIFDLLNFEYKLKIDLIFSTNLGENLKSHDKNNFNSIGINVQYNDKEVSDAVQWFLETRVNAKRDIFNKYIQDNFTLILDLNNNEMMIKYIYILVVHNLIKISHIYFNKSSDNDNYMPLQDMSSGQRSILSSFSSIAAYIKHGSVIFIDEPEISLHPSWASKYIDFLQTKFNNFNNCHFIIATHSPHIVSNLPSDDAYVVTIKNDGTSKCIKAESFNFKSIDFQLAEIFDFPGNRNEYLIRVIMVLLTKLNEKKILDSNDLETADHLRKFIPKLKDEDPVKHLIKQLMTLI